MAEVDEWIAKYLQIVDRGIAMIPYGRAKIWKESFFNPSSVVTKDNVGVGERLKDLYVMSAVELLLGLIAVIPLLAVMTLFTMGAGVIWMGIVAGLIVVSFLLGPIFAFLYSLLEYVVARALGGAGDIRANFNASALPGLAVFVITLPLLVARVPFGWLQAIPIVNLCASILELPLDIALLIAGIYGLYLRYLAMKEVHKLSSMRAAGVVIIPVVAVVVLFVVIAILLYIFIIAAMLGSIGAMGAAGGLRPG
jgi:hypothetical protein